MKKDIIRQDIILPRILLGSCLGSAKKKASSRQALGILKGYGWSMPRVCLEYGWSIAGVWLEYAKGVTCHLNHVLRLAAVLLLMIGVQNAWG